MISKNILQQIFFFTYEHLRADTISARPTRPFPNFIFKMNEGFCLLKMICQFIPQKCFVK